MKKLRLFPLMLSTTLMLSGCSLDKNNDFLFGKIQTSEKKIESFIDKKEENVELETKEVEYESEEGVIQSPAVEELEKTRSIDDAIITKNLIVLKNSNVHINPDVNSEVSFIISEGTIVDEYTYQDGFYYISNGGFTGYIKESLVEEKTNITFPYDYEKLMYCFDDTFIKLQDGTTVDIPANSCVEVYETYDNFSVLAKVGDYVGIMLDDYLFDFPNTYVVVDISDQELKLYQDNEVILTTPVVTGTPTESRQSDTGLFTVYDISHNRYLVGPNYKSYVDYMIKYNGGEGLHDAEYHTHEDGFSHGWRNYSEFGGTTYLTNGSHGCINMPHDAAEFTYNVINTAVNENKEEVKVLVKQ